MAQIFETRDDFLRERLARGIEDARKDAKYGGNGAILLGALAKYSHQVQKIEPHIYDANQSKFSNYLRKYGEKLVMWVAIAGMAFSATKWIVSLQIAKKMQARLDMLGPVKTLVPEDDLNPIKFTDSIQQVTLTDNKMKSWIHKVADEKLVKKEQSL